MFTIGGSEYQSYRRRPLHRGQPARPFGEAQGANLDFAEAAGTRLEDGLGVPTSTPKLVLIRSPTGDHPPSARLFIDPYVTKYTGIGANGSRLSGKFGSYLRSGADGILWRSIDNKVALKVLAKERFYREELHVLQQLHGQPQAVAESRLWFVELLGFDEAHQTLLMPLYPDGSLHDFAGSTEGRRWLADEEKLVQLLRPLLDGLTHMHDVIKMVHLDLKPGNILIGRDPSTNDPRLLIGDFGCGEPPPPPLRPRQPLPPTLENSARMLPITTPALRPQHAVVTTPRLYGKAREAGFHPSAMATPRSTGCASMSSPQAL